MSVLGLLETSVQILRTQHAEALMRERAPKTRRVGVTTSSLGTSAEIFHGCATQVIQRVDPGRFSLAFIDPPFNIGEPYDGFNDRETPADHVATVWGFQKAFSDYTAGKTVVAWHVPEAMLFPVLDSARALGLELWRQVVRTFEFGVFQRAKWINAHENLLLFCHGAQLVRFHPENVLIASARLKGGDKRTTESDWGGYRQPGTVWSFPRVQGNNRERWKKHPNQLPFAYLARIVAGHTQPGDTVFDACAGSGGLGVVCAAMGRNYVGCDISAANAESGWARICDAQQLELAAAVASRVSERGRAE